MDIKEYWVSSIKKDRGTSTMTFWVKTEDDIIVDVAPIGKKFIGQKFDALRNWMEKQGDFLCETLSSDDGL